MSTSSRDSYSVGQPSNSAPNSVSWGRVSRKLLAACPLFLLCLFAAGKAQAQDGFYMNQGAKFDSRGDFDSAIAQYSQALAVCPGDVQAYTSRGFDWYRKGDYDKAIADFDQVVANARNSGTAYDNRAAVESSKGDYDKANADFYRALAVDPYCATNYQNLAFFQATCPDAKYRDGQKAFANASRGYQTATPADAYYAVNALAAAYAECGDFAAAQSWQAKVVEMAPPSDKQLQSARLDLYKQNKPYRSAVKSPLQVRSDPPRN